LAFALGPCEKQQMAKKKVLRPFGLAEIFAAQKAMSWQKL